MTPLKSHPILAASLSLILLFISCSTNNPTDPAPQVGSMTGFVALLDGNGYRLPIQDSVNVTILGEQKSALTDTTGRWEITGISTGVYDLVFEKPGFCSVKKFGVMYMADSSFFFGDLSMFQPPTFTVSVDTVETIEESLFVSLVFHESQNSIRPLGAVVFFGRSRDISSDPAKYLVAYSCQLSLYAQSDTARIRFSMRSMRGYGIPPSGTGFVVAYPSVFYSYNAYYDPNTGRTVFPDLSPTPSDIDSFIVLQAPVMTP